MTAAPATRSERTGILASLQNRTKQLHREAEQSGVLAGILRGEASRNGYLLFLRNLHPAYRAMEQGLARHHQTPGLDRLSAYRLDRAGAIAADLESLQGRDWASAIPLLPAGAAYEAAVAEAAEGNGHRLIAHAYTRYLGDLSGGQIVQKQLAKTMQLRPDQLSLYSFAGFPDPAILKSDYRQALEYAGSLADDPASIIEESAKAFSCNIALSIAVARVVAKTTSSG